MLGKTVLDRRCLRALRLAVHSSVSLVVTFSLAVPRPLFLMQLHSSLTEFNTSVVGRRQIGCFRCLQEGERLVYVTTLIKACQSLSLKTAMPKGGSY